MEIEDILKDYNPKRLSNGQIRMKCPFRENHKDGSGKMSFFVSPDKGAYHCFSCGEHGSAVKLLTNMFDVGFFDAVELVKIAPLMEVTKDKLEFSLDITWGTEPPTEFLDRGFSEETLKHFRVGYSYDAMKDSKGDFIKCMIIPFFTDFNKPTIATLSGFQKRINVPDRVVINSSFFDKQHYLYNLDHSYNYTVLVEGYSDAMRLYQHGYNATALLGTSLSDWQVEQLSKFDIVYLALDNDPPGMKITEVAYRKLYKHTEVKLIPYTTKDPGDMAKRPWIKCFNSATSYEEYSFYMSMNYEDYDQLKSKVLKQLE